jgi:hypothetical protein
VLLTILKLRADDSIHLMGIDQSFQIRNKSMLTILGLLGQETPEQKEKHEAMLELARKTQGYSANTTKVALVMSKTRSDDLRWLRDYLKTEYVHHRSPYPRM